MKHSLRLIAALGACAALAACASAPVVAVPVAMSCVPKELKEAPHYTASQADLKAATPGERYTLAVGGVIERDQRLSEIEPALARCRQIGK